MTELLHVISESAGAGTYTNLWAEIRGLDHFRPDIAHDDRVEVGREG